MRFSWLIMVLLLGCSPTQKAPDIEFEQLRQEYYAGQLESTKEKLLPLLEGENLTPDQIIEAHLLLSEIYDRIGLHWNTRPVPEASVHLGKARALFDQASQQMKGKISLTNAMVEYRKNLSTKEFAESREQALTALEIFIALDDLHGQADAVHRLGLIHFQLGEFEAAAEKFDLSLKYEEMSGQPRPFLLSDFERHMGLIFERQDQKAAALPYFYRSWDIRKNGGLFDAAMFAAISVAFTLVDLNEFEQARDPADYAVKVAEEINSPMGKAYSYYISGVIYARSNDLETARQLFDKSLQAARLVESEVNIKRAEEALARL